MKPIIILIFFLLTFSLISCVEESPLSDVNFDDPSIVKPVIFINKDITTNSIRYSNITWLYDKNNNSIELKSGKVLLNDIDMNIEHGFNNEPYYSIPFDILPFRLNTIYESKIALSDGKFYISSVITREKDLYRLNVPAEHNKNEDLYLSWADADNDNKLILSVVLTGSNDSTNYADAYKFDIPNPFSGNFIISKNYFMNRPEINKALLTLEAINTGEINKSFMNGSKITSAISITKSIKLK